MKKICVELPLLDLRGKSLGRLWVDLELPSLPFSTQCVVDQPKVYLTGLQPHEKSTRVRVSLATTSPGLSQDLFFASVLSQPSPSVSTAKCGTYVTENGALTDIPGLHPIDDTTRYPWVGKTWEPHQEDWQERWGRNLRNNQLPVS